MAHSRIPPINPLANPQAGLQVSRVEVTYEDDETAVQIGTFPAGSTILDVYAITTTAHDDSGAVTLDVGVDGDVDSIVDGANVKSAGATDLTVIDGGRYLSSEDIVVATLLAANDDATAGATTVVVVWLAAE